MIDNEVKKVIINAASMFFSKYGYKKTTIDEIARHVHKAKGLIYYYFQNKEDLFNEVLKSQLFYVKRELSKITESNICAFDMIEQHILLRYELLSNVKSYHEILKADFFEKYNFVKDVRDDFYNFEKNQIIFIINKAQNEGKANISNIENTANLIHLILNCLEISLYVKEKYEEYKETCKELIQFIIQVFKSDRIEQ